MRLLLDTHVLLWTLAYPERLGDHVKNLITDPRTSVLVSAASIWEMEIKSALGKLQRPENIDEIMLRRRFEELPIKGSHARAVGHLPFLHRDPFDRMLIAQAHSEGLTLVTQDVNMLRYGGKMLRADR